jgi:hypothetical protein
MHRAILVLAAAAAAGVVVAASSGQTSSVGKTIALYSKARGDTIATAFVDLPPKATKKNPNLVTPGDIIFQTVRLHGKSGAVIGKEYDELTFVTPSNDSSSVDLVRSTFVFADGTIYSVGRHAPGSNYPDAVIGGTGAYAGARGTLTSAGPDEDLIHLLP